MSYRSLVRTICVLWWMLAGGALAAVTDPGKTAIDFLEKVRAGTINLEPGGDTALTEHASATKREQISRRLKRMVMDLGSDPLEVGAVRLDGDLAAVLVRKSGSYDPSRNQIFPVAVVKRGETWAAAPVPASFENTGFRYATAQRERRAALQNWMLREQVLQLAILREQSLIKMRQIIETSLPLSTLRKLGSLQTGEHFLAACEQRKLPEILALLGGHANPLPDDWSRRITAAESAVSSLETESQWRLLMATDVLRAIVHNEEDDSQALVSVACLDAASSDAQKSGPCIKLVHLELSKSPGGLWRIDLPEIFYDPQSAEIEEDDEVIQDSELLNHFPAKLAKLHPPVPEATAEAAFERLRERLQAHELVDLVRMIRPDSDGESARKNLLTATRLWQSIQDPAGGQHIMPLAQRSEVGKATAIWQFFSPRAPDRLKLVTISIEQSPAGWSWVPNGQEPSSDEELAWIDEQTTHWQENWRTPLFAESITLEALPDGGAPEEEQARAVVEAWLHAIAKGDLVAALRLTARLKLPDSQTTVLRNLGYEMIGSPKNVEPTAITGTYSGKIWTAVAVSTMQDGKAAQPLYPVVSTPSGPRILAEVDLFASQSRSRDFLNKNALARLDAFPPAADELREMLNKHQKDGK